VDQVQSWVAIIGSLAAALLGILKYFNYKSRRDRVAAVGSAFNSTVDGLSSDSDAKRLAAAILLRRFFDVETEQGEAGTPYSREAIAVIAALLRHTPGSELQKLLADGLGYAPSLRKADLQGCNLSNAYLGQRQQAPRRSRRAGKPLGSFLMTGTPSERAATGVLGGPERFDAPVDLSGADLFEADLSGASLRNALAHEAVFYKATLRGAVLENAHLDGADFRGAELERARFAGARLAGAKFDGATDIPTNVERLLDENGIVPPGYTEPVRPQ
jgi:hypothetical protein